MLIVSGNLSKLEIKILLLIARLTISFDKANVSLSKGAIAQNTHGSGSNILNCLKLLEEKQLLQKSAGNSKFEANKWQLRFDLSFIKGDRSPPGQPSTPGAKTTPTDWQNSNPKRQGQIVPYYKQDFENDIQNNFSSDEKYLQTYLESCRPLRKKQLEIKSFDNLRSQYSETDIARCLRFILDQGTLGNKKDCQSPMAYLAVAIESVLKKSHMSQYTQHKIISKSEKEKLEAEQEKEDEKIFKQAEESFMQTLSVEDQTRFIKSFSANVPFLNPTRPAI